MKKIFFIALIMFNIFTLLEAHPFPTDEKLYEYCDKIDSKLQKELKNFPNELTKDEKNNLKKETVSEDPTIVTFKKGEYLYVYSKNLKDLQGIYKVNSKGEPDGAYKEFLSKNKFTVGYHGKNGFEGYLRQYEDGKLIGICSAYAGKLEGIRKIYYPNGKLREEFRYFDGLENGKGTLYHKNGKIGAIQNFKDGVLHGELIEYYENGNIKIKGFFKDGKENGVCEEYDINGKLTRKVTYKEGTWTNISEWNKIIKLTKNYYLWQ